MSEQQRDFSNFELQTDSVYSLADNLISELADRFAIDHGAEPTVEVLGELVGKLGKNEVLRANEPVQALSPTEMADYLDQSGVQKALNRSLWTPQLRATPRKLDGYVLTGAVANWQDRAANKLASYGTKAPVYIFAGERIMDSVTEKPNPNVKAVFETFKRYPTEAEYAAGVVQRKLVERGFDVLPSTYAGTKGETLAIDFFDRNPHLLDGRIAAVRVANAGIQLAVQLRHAARAIRPDFDSDPSNPQMFVMTDSLPVSRSQKQDAKPLRYQKAQTGLRQVAVTAKSILEAQQDL